MERDVVGRSEARQGGEELEVRVVPAQLDGEERLCRGVEIQRPKRTRDVGIGKELIEEAARLGVAGAQQIAVEPLDEGGRGGLPVDDEGPKPLRMIGGRMALGDPTAAAADGSRNRPMTRFMASLVMRMFQCRSSTMAG